MPKPHTYLRWRLFIKGGFSKTHVVDLDTLNHDVTQGDLKAGGIPLLCGRSSPLALYHMLKPNLVISPCRNCLKVLKSRE